MRHVSLIILLLISFSSCKKDELKYEKQLLEGKWKWAGSTRWVTFQGSVTSETHINSSQFGSTFELNFDRKGRVQYLTDNKEIENYRVVFKSFETVYFPPLTNYKFVIALNNKKDNHLRGRINSDTLFANPEHIPLQNSSDDNYNIDTIYNHYFLRNN